MFHLFNSNTMNRYSSLLCMAALSLMTSLPMQAQSTELLPKPHILTHTDCVPFALGRAVQLADPSDCAYLRTVLENYGCTLSETAQAQVTVELVTSIPEAFNHQVAQFPDEAYQLDITTDAIRIQALTPTGVIRAAQTLQQLGESSQGSGSLETLHITDWPAFKVRGFMHDVGRSFLSLEELKNEIDKLARFKVNVFHWHLTEKLAWRFEVKAYPQLTADENMIRYAGQYYTQDQCRELEAYAAERGVTIIPEIDMPGHSDVFTKAMGFSMQTDQGVAALKVILDEVIDVFPNAPYIHIGGDEVTITYPNFLKTMADYVRGKGKKVVMWNRLVAGPPTAEQCDMTQMWATAGRVVSGLPNIDCRYNYTNHFDVYADLVGIYKSNIYYTQQGTADVAGTISAAWNDTKTPTETDIVRQNNIYANILASAERAWYGGGQQYVEVGGTTLPNAGEEYEEFADFERRFLFHKAHSLQNEPISYVKQTNVHWRITEPFPNNGNNALALPPELCTDEILPHTFDYEGKTYTSFPATGAGIYLRHIWHPTIPSFFANPANNQTAYAWTYVYSPVEQQAGAQIEFYTYSRSGSETAPPTGAWDRRGSKIWLNGEEIAAPEWQQPNAAIPQDHAEKGLTNENLTARPVVQLTLKEGWNKVFMRLPHVNNGGTGRDKWQFTFVLTDTEGKNALDGIIYSPNQCLDAASEAVANALDEAENFIVQHCNDRVGYYPAELAAETQQKVNEVRATLSQQLTETERNQQTADLTAALDALKQKLETADINQPKAYTDSEPVCYCFNTPYRESRYPTSQGEGQALTGETTAGKAATWKFVARTDGTFNIVNANDRLYISPASDNNKPLTTTAAEPEAGWSLLKTGEPGYVIITSGTVQFNQTNAGNGYKVFNWGGGNNTTDTGCKYMFEEVELPSAPKLSTDTHTYWYEFCTPLRGNRYPTSQGVGQHIVGETTATDASVWKFETRADGSFNIVNRQDNAYVSPEAANNTALSTTATEPAAGWEFKEAATSGYYILVSGTSQFNQTNNAGQGWKVFNWGGGSNTTDTGCQYSFTLVDEVTVPTAIKPAQQPQTDPQNTYDLSGRRLLAPAKGIYIENGEKRIR
ncbi:MAG: family 20 glycosylhydrolase [Bacteroidales bacterium]|nr:family 20 glycosylhydrolase [Bacteroidales bacterium]